jgi:hypothetical protein
MTTSRIEGMRCELADRTVLESVLAFTQNAAEIRRFVSAVHRDTPPEHRAFYDPGSATASFVTIWRGRLVCLLALAVSEGQAQAIDSKMETIGVTAWMSLGVFQDAVEYALDVSVNSGHPKSTYLAQWTEGPRS